MEMSRTDSERLNFILDMAAGDFRFDVHDILGDYDGDDHNQYLELARQAIDQAMDLTRESLASTSGQGTTRWLRRFVKLSPKR